MKKTSYKRFLQKIFKNFFYLLFKLKHGKITYNKEVQKNLFKEENVIFENVNQTYSYSIFSCSNSRLYTNRIQDTAVIKNNILLDKPSFQLRDNKFDTDIKKNIVLRNGTPNFQKKISGSVLSLLTGGGGNNNFYHWLFDVLPRIGIVEKKININNIDFFLCPNLNKWQIETLKLLGINSKRCLSSVKYRHIKAKNIITTSHPYITGLDVIKDIENLPLWISEWLRDKFLNLKSNKEFPKKIYIDRSDSQSNLKDFRFIINEIEVIDLLKKKDFTTLRLSDLNFEEEIKLFNEVEIVVGLHGAGLSNLIWCNKNSKIIELKNKYTNKVFENLAQQNNINYKSLEYEPTEKFISDHYGSIKVDLDELDKLT